MPTEILMPALSPTMTEGNLARWLKAEGDPVAAGEVIAEIETDKATMEIEAIDEGTLGRILVAEGAEGIAVNTPIALLLAEGEDASALDRAAPPAAPAVAESPAAAAAGTLGDDGSGRQRRQRRRGRSRTRSRQAPPWSGRPCARRCATPWRRRCGAIRTSS